MTALDLSALEALEREATPAPWRWDIDSDKSWEADMGSIAASGVTVMWFGDAETYYPTCGSPPNDADRDFLLALRNSFPALAAELRAAREVVEKVRRLEAEWLEEGRERNGPQSSWSHGCDLGAVLVAYDAAVSGARSSLKDPAGG